MDALNMIELLKAELKRSREAEQQLSRAYVRLRALIPGAFDTPYAPTPEQIWETTESALKRLVTGTHPAPWDGDPSWESFGTKNASEK